MFDRIRIEGFRRLASVDLALRPLNVVIGANGSGKTSLLDVFSLLKSSASGTFKESINAHGGIDANLADVSGGKSKAVTLELTLPTAAEGRLEYRVALEPQGIGYRYSDENLTDFREADSEPIVWIESKDDRVRYFERKKRGFAKPFWEHDRTESVLSQIPRMYPRVEELRSQLASSTHYHVLKVDERAPVRLPQQMRDAQLPGRDGENLVSCLYTLRETEPDRYEAVEAALQAAFPRFERLNFPPVAAGMLAMTWKETTSKQPFYMHQLSEGTLRFLWLVTLLHSPGLTAVTLIDEPEVSLHPELLSLLADLFREASTRTQLIVATHADRLIRFLKPEEVVAIDLKEDGAAEFTRADALDLDKWLEDYTLDEVWQLGRLGGRA